MSGFGDLLGGVIGGALSAGNPPVAGGALGAGGNGAMIAAVLSLINQHGGLQGLLQKLEASGLGAAAQSWVGTGANESVSADQITQALGSGGVLGQFAQQLGLDHDAAGGLLAQVLPQVVDHLTPGGQVSQHNELGDLAKQLLGNSKLFG